MLLATLGTLVSGAIAASLPKGTTERPNLLLLFPDEWR